MKMNDLEFIPKEFVFADIWTSDDLHTNLSLHQLLDTIMEYAPERSYDDKRIMLRNNFTVKIVTEKFDAENTFSLVFFRYYHRFYAVYFIIALIASYIVAFSTLGIKPGLIALIFFLLPIPLIWKVFETIRRIKGIKRVDYSKEAERVYSEILNAIKEKEKEFAMTEVNKNS